MRVRVNRAGPIGRPVAAVTGARVTPGRRRLEASWLARFRAVLLDMNGTFMFGHDRFSHEVDYAATYAALGGTRLSPATVNDVVRTFVAAYGRLYADADPEAALPSVIDVLRAGNRTIPDEEIAKVEAVIAAHEIGTIPPSHAAALRRLAARHRLGVVSNLWSRSGPWHDAFARSGVEELFDVILFSSEHGCIKPAPRLFHMALDAVRLPPGDVVFIGDDLCRDVAGAQRVGLATVWIGSAHRITGDDPRPDLVVDDLCDLVI